MIYFHLPRTLQPAPHYIVNSMQTVDNSEVNFSSLPADINDELRNIVHDIVSASFIGNRV